MGDVSNDRGGESISATIHTKVDLEVRFEALSRDVLKESIAISKMGV